MHHSELAYNLRQELMKTDNIAEFSRALYRFLLKCPASEPIEFEGVFEQAHRPRFKQQLIDSVISFQKSGILLPNRHISFNSDLSRFQIIDMQPPVNPYKFNKNVHDRDDESPVPQWPEHHKKLLEQDVKKISHQRTTRRFPKAARAEATIQV